MSRMRGKPRNWFEATLIGVGFPVLLGALVLAAATPSASAFPPASMDIAEEASAEGIGTPDDSVMHPSPATADLTGWELYLHSAMIEPPGSVPGPASRLLPALPHGVAAPSPAWFVALPVRLSYRPQAPPA